MDGALLFIELLLFQMLNLRWEQRFPPDEEDVGAESQGLMFSHPIAHGPIREKVVPLQPQAVIQVAPPQSLLDGLDHPLRHAVNFGVFLGGLAVVNQLLG